MANIRVPFPTRGLKFIDDATGDTLPICEFVRFGSRPLRKTIMVRKLTGRSRMSYEEASGSFVKEAMFPVLRPSVYFENSATVQQLIATDLEQRI